MIITMVVLLNSDKSLFVLLIGIKLLLYLIREMNVVNIKFKKFKHTSLVR